LFVASLGYFLFTYSITFAEITEGAGASRPVIIDIALFSVFALHHSIFARERIRAFVRRQVSAQLERSVYVWVASLMLIGVCYAWRPVAGVLWQVPAPWSWAFIAVQLLGAWLTIRSAAVIDPLDLAGVRQVLTPDVQLPASNSQVEFKTDGPYGWVRHPIYAGWIILVFSVGTMTMTRLVFAIVSTAYLLIAIPFEERTLQSHAATYADYKRLVPWKLIPRVY
jgi:protein-S-isoprenylcysteine O-methyltransferase Ste14